MTSSFGYVLFLITWYKASLKIKRDFSFVIVPLHSCFKESIWTVISHLVSWLWKVSFLTWVFSLKSFGLNKCDSHKKMSDYFESYLLAFIKKVLTKNLNFLLFPNYVPVTLIKSKLQIHPANPRNSDILKFITKFS